MATQRDGTGETGVNDNRGDQVNKPNQGPSEERAYGYDLGDERADLSLLTRQESVGQRAARGPSGADQRIPLLNGFFRDVHAAPVEGGHHNLLRTIAATLVRIKDNPAAIERFAFDLNDQSQDILYAVNSLPSDHTHRLDQGRDLNRDQSRDQNQDHNQGQSRDQGLTQSRDQNPEQTRDPRAPTSR